MLGVRSKRKLLYILFSVLAASILVACLAAKIELTKANDENTALKQEFSDLKEANVRLRLEYESGVNLPELEEYAKTALGMQKPESEQVIEIQTATKDKTVIYKNSIETDTDKLVSSIKEYLSLIKCKLN